MKRVLFSIIIILLIVYNGVAQESITLRGEVLNSDNETAVSFAHVGLCEKAIGTVSNEDGIFEFKVAPYLINDTLCISAIGFITYKERISNLMNTDFMNIKLEPQTSVLQEVIISDNKITGRRVVEKAISRIYKNYPSKPFILEGYYRDYMKRNNNYDSFLEGAITVQDMGYKKSDDKTRVRVNQLRFQENYQENYEKYLHKDESDTLKEVMAGVSTEFFANEFYNMRYHNPVRNQYETLPFVGVFHNFHESNYEFDIAYYTYVDEEEVYVIRFKPKPEYNYLHINVKGEIFIRVRDHGILKFHYSFFVRDFTKDRKVYELNMEYRDYMDKLFLKYISYVNFFKIYLGYEIGEISKYREFFVTDIHYPDFEAISKEESIDNTIPLHQLSIEEDPDFWNNYNLILQQQPVID
jgi:hypothetical protein